MQVPLLVENIDNDEVKDAWAMSSAGRQANETQNWNRKVAK